MSRDNSIIFPRKKNLKRIVIALPAGIFMSEIAAMLLILFYKGPYLIAILIDAIVTTTLMLPLIYTLSYRPLLNHIAKRERAERIMLVRLQMMQFSIAHTGDELLRAILDEIEALSGSSISYFYSLEPDGKTLLLQAWSTNTTDSIHQVESQNRHFDLAEAGAWTECIHQRRPVIHNNNPSPAHRNGLPEGHAPVFRELTVPILRDGRVVAILRVGNNPQEYNEEDVELVSTLSDFAWDIIKRKQAEEALRESEEKFRTLVTWTYDWELWVDPQGNIVYSSPACERISGYPAEEFIQKPHFLLDIVHPDDRQFYGEHNQLVHDKTAGISSLEYRVIAQNGGERWIEHNCRPLFGSDDRYLGRRISNRDITERKQAEKEIVKRNQNEMMLTQVIHNMQLEIARDLHDTVGQNIGYLRMKLDHLSETDLQTDIGMKSEIENMLKVANESYDLIRGTLAVLQSGGLADPLTLFIQYANQIENRTTLKIKVSSQGEPRPLSPNQVRQLFFVFREALSNIEKHAKASEVLVKLAWADDSLSLMIADDGRGVRAEDMQMSGRYGLKFMQERIASINGAFSISSKNDSGTKIKINLPIVQK